MVQSVTQSNIFFGFSSADRTPDNTKIFDIELIKQDLINQLYTRKGERVMLPEYGSIIWDMLFEPFNQGTVSIVTNDVIRIIQSDPRIQFNDIDISEQEYGFSIKISCLFRPYDIVDIIVANFDRRSLENRGS